MLTGLTKSGSRRLAAGETDGGPGDSSRRSRWRCTECRLVGRATESEGGCHRTTTSVRSHVRIFLSAAMYFANIRGVEEAERF